MSKDGSGTAALQEKALEYIRNTPRTDEYLRHNIVMLGSNALIEFARTLERELDESRDKADALNIVLAVVSAKASVEAKTLREMLKQAYEELRAKRWLS